MRPEKNLCQGAGIVAGKTGESGDICGRNLKMSTTMEIMTIESNAYRLLVEKIEKITAYVEESRNREETERKRKEEAESPVTKGRKADPKWMTHKEVCEALDISHRTPATLPPEEHRPLFDDRAADTLSPAGCREPA